MTFTRTAGLCRPFVATAIVGLFVAHDAMAQPGPMATGDDAWRFSVGAGVFSRPKYPGSGDTKIVAVPVLSANYGRFFIGGTPSAGLPLGIGAYLIQNETWRAGVAVGADLDKPREASDAPILNGWGDISATTLAAAFGSYTHQWLTLRAAVVSDIGGHGAGTRVMLDAEAKYSPMEGLLLSAGPGITWANNSYTQTYFGINAAQSVVAGVPQYNTSSGINALNFAVGAFYRLSANWNIGARVNAVWLQGDAANSPITEDKSQNVYGLFASYLF